LQLFVWGEKDAWMTDERADTVKEIGIPISCKPSSSPLKTGES
jgi:hypothetical protein